MVQLQKGQNDKPKVKINKYIWLSSLMSGVVVQGIFGLWYVDSELFTANLGSFLLFLPMSVGMISFALALFPFIKSSTRKEVEYYSALFLIPLFSSIVILIGSVLLISPLACFVVIVAPYILFSSLGIFIGFLLYSGFLLAKGRFYNFGLALALPIFSLWAESTMPINDSYHTLQTSLVVEGSAEKVWSEIIEVPRINDSELSTHFIYLVGIPKPRSSSLDKEAVGGIRTITWDEGVEFEERIVQWNPPRSFHYEIQKKHMIPKDKIDEHIQIGGPYFDVLRGSYQLEKISDDKTLVHLSVVYRVSTSMNWYAKWWADFFLDDLQLTILEVIKNRVENS